VIATPERRKHARARRDVICGRRNCGRCTRWYLITDFSGTRWADVHKTTPRIFNSWCKACARQRKREQSERRRSHMRPDQLEFYELKAAFARMTLQDRQEYQWDLGLPLSRSSEATEDHDTTPVPQGCPRCFLRDQGEICTNCPDIELRQRARKMGAKRAWTTLSLGK
jgi:hypothetical protein